MKISKYFVVLGLLAGGLGAIGGGLSLRKETYEVKAEEKDLSSIISSGNRNYSLSHIGNFFFDFNTSEQIFTRTGYMNDHLNEFLDENGDPINLAEGIIINGHTFKYWVDFTPETLSYPRNSGVAAFPLYASKVFNPVAIEVTTSKIAFKVNLDYMPMDSIVVTFKAGIFKGYYNGNTFSLSEDLTFYSTLNETPTSSNSEKISFVKARHETIINAQITQVADWGEKTNSQDGKFHRYLITTNIPRNKDYVGDTFPATHYAFVYNNYMLNNKSFTTINSWVRGNSKDFIDLSDKTSITAEYEAATPGGAISINECLGLTIEHPADKDNYVALVYVPNQLITDFGFESVSFTLRDGSAWFTKDKEANPIIGRINRAVFANMISSRLLELNNYVDLSAYSTKEQAQISTIISQAQASMNNAFMESDLDEIVGNAKTSIDQLPDINSETQQKHINEVVAIIDAIVYPIEYTAECSNSINQAMEAFAGLTESEIAKFPSEKRDALYSAYSEFAALDLANYKSLSKAEILTKFNLDDYRELQKSAINDLVEIANTSIDNATSKEKVEEAVTTFEIALSLVKTDKELAKEELLTAKENAKAELDAIDITIYSEQAKALIEELISNGKIAIDQCKSIDEVETLLNKIKTVINSFTSEVQASALAEARLAKETKGQTISISSLLGGALAIVLGISLAIVFIRKRKTN